MSGRWDEERTLASELKKSKYFDSENMIDKLAKDGIELHKLPEHFVLDEAAKKQLIADIDKMVDNLDGLDAMADTIMGFLRGYAFGIAEATSDKKMIDL